jgi:hypothetical protein
MSKKKYYMVLDSETATLPIINDFDDKFRQKISIAKPLIYDIGWTICDRQGTIVEKRNFLVQETFFVPNIFNTAYYKDKRPIYIDMLEKNEIIAKNWNDIVKSLLNDIQTVEFVAAYNACFDFKKAIPFTEKYIQALYSSYYNVWEQQQKKSIENIIGGDTPKNPDYLNPTFEIRGLQIGIVDLWAVSTETLLNTNKFKKFCFENKLFSQSGVFFSTSAETCYNYLQNNPDFKEKHTALDDACIETYILMKAFKRKTVKPVIKAFPFRDLSTTLNYVENVKKDKQQNIETLLQTFQNYFNASPNPSKQALKAYLTLLEKN